MAGRPSIGEYGISVTDVGAFGLPLDVGTVVVVVVAAAGAAAVVVG
jgi:hypothetical protein